MTTARQCLLTMIFVAVAFSIVTGGISYAQVDDAYEDNDTRATAWSPGRDWEDEWLSSISGLGIQADDDWYEINVSAGHELVLVECLFTHSEGDIDICLVDSLGNIVSCSTGIWDNESIDVVVPAGGGTYYILAYYENGGNAYDLWWDDYPPPPDDAYEDNDTLATAWYPGRDWEDEWLSSISGLGIQTDEDWYEIYVSAGYEHVLVECLFTHSEGDIDICLVDSQGYFVSCSTGVWDNESIDVVVPASGTYYIRVYYGNARNTYDLWWRDYPILCSTLGNDLRPYALDQDIYKFNGTEGEIVTVRLEADPPEAGWGERATLVLRNVTGGLQLFKRRDTGLPHEITVTLPFSGEYRVVVGESTGSAILWGERYIGDYCVTLQATPDTCQTFETATSVE